MLALSLGIATIRRRTLSHWTVKMWTCTSAMASWCIWTILRENRSDATMCKFLEVHYSFGSGILVTSCFSEWQSCDAKKCSPSNNLRCEHKGKKDR